MAASEETASTTASTRAAPVEADEAHGDGVAGVERKQAPSRRMPTPRRRSKPPEHSASPPPGVSLCFPARELMQELQPGEAFFLLPAHLFRSVLSFVSLASSLLLLLSSSAAATAGGGTGDAGKKPGAGSRSSSTARRPTRYRSKFSDDFLLADGGNGEGDEEADTAAQKEEKQQQPAEICVQERERPGFGAPLVEDAK